MIHTLVNAVPAADIFDTGTAIFEDLGNLFVVGAIAGVGWFLLKEIFKIRTVMAGVIAVASAALLYWGVTQTQNKDISNMFQDTITNSSGGGATAPAKKG